MSEQIQARYDAVNRAIFGLDEQCKAMRPDDMMKILITQLAKVMALTRPFAGLDYVEAMSKQLERWLREAYPPMARIMIDRGQQLAAISGQDTDAVRLAMVAAFNNTDEIWTFVHGQPKERN
jgi:hypothetical protein